MDKLYLSNGIEIPNLCFGTGITGILRMDYSRLVSKNTFRLIKYNIENIIRFPQRGKRDRSFGKIVNIGMQNGCHMFDTSRAYMGSEWRLGKALKKYKREEYFIVTKIDNYSQFNDNIEGCLRKSLDELNMSYVDLCLLHWPVPEKYVKSWLELERMYKKGLCRSIGVSNCNISHIETIKKYCNILPMVNEFECHPLFTQNDLREYCKREQIQVLAYTATARMDNRFNDSFMPELAQKYNKNIAQVILRWHQQIGNIPIVNSTNPKHFVENTLINDFSLSKEDVEKILSLNINSRLRYDPENCDFTKL